MIEYTPQPRQLVLHRTIANQILYGGQAGGGKSHALRWDAIEMALRLPKFSGVLFRRTSPQLEKNHVKFLRQLPKEVGAYHEQKKTFNFKNGSEIIIKHLEHEHDVDDIQGWEIHWAGVDEAGQCTEYQLEYIKSRMRISEKLKEEWLDLANTLPPLEKYHTIEAINRLPRYVLSANPGGESHHYLKERYIDPAPAETLFHDSFTRDESDPDDKGATTIFIPATLDDNKYLGREYRRQFSGMPEWQKKMLRDGDWNIVPGAFFECWGPQHILKPFKIPAHWTKFRAMDWGFATPFCILWVAVSDGEPIETKHGEVCLPKESLVVYREWYGSKGRNKGIRKRAEEVAQGILDKEVEKISYSVADPAAWRTDSGPCVAEKMWGKDVYFRKADNERVF